MILHEGGGVGMGLPVNDQTISAIPLKLTNKEMNSIIAFLQTLTDDQDKSD
jgi:cytochrome c peroxidase